MSAFDPTPGEPYGKCNTCSVVLATEADAHEHMRSTMTDGRSHSVRITNPPRPQRIRSRVATVVEDALCDAMDALDRLTRNGLSDDEITEALRMWPDFGDAWSEHVAEGGE